MTPARCRGARAMLDWTQAKLAEAAGVGVSTVTSFERSWRCNYPDTIQAIQRALEAAGIDFIAENDGGPGVRFRKGRMTSPRTSL